MSTYQSFLLIAGLVFTALGGLVVFSDSFLEYMYRTWWKRTELAKKLFPGESGYFFDRYGRGLGALLVGIGMLIALLMS